MVLGDAVSKLETFVWILNHISRSITWSLFTLKTLNFVKWPISTWSFTWWCQIIDWLKFETRPSSLLNFGTAYDGVVVDMIFHLLLDPFSSCPGLRSGLPEVGLLLASDKKCLVPRLADFSVPSWKWNIFFKSGSNFLRTICVLLWKSESFMRSIWISSALTKCWILVTYLAQKRSLFEKINEQSKTIMPSNCICFLCSFTALLLIF